MSKDEDTFIKNSGMESDKWHEPAFPFLSLLNTPTPISSRNGARNDQRTPNSDEEKVSICLETGRLAPYVYLVETDY